MMPFTNVHGVYVTPNDYQGRDKINRKWFQVTLSWNIILVLKTLYPKRQGTKILIVMGSRVGEPVDTRPVSPSPHSRTHWPSALQFVLSYPQIAQAEWDTRRGVRACVCSTPNPAHFPVFEHRSFGIVTVMRYTPLSWWTLDQTLPISHSSPYILLDSVKH